jgi:hypothetical protein
MRRGNEVSPVYEIGLINRPDAELLSAELVALMIIEFWLCEMYPALYPIATAYDPWFVYPACFPIAIELVPCPVYPAS